MLVGINKSTQNKLEGATQGAFKSLFSLIPPFSIALGAWEGYQDARLTELINELTDRVSRIENDNIDFEYIESEECYDLIQKGLKIRLQHRSKLKAKFICNMIVESVSKNRDPRFSTSLKESFLALLDEMSDLEQEFLRDFNKGEYEQKSRNDVYKEKDASAAIALDGLYRLEILRDADTWQKWIEVSALGREFIEYIKILSHQPSTGAIRY